ncbi:unnamed protein product [Owenia fusiformis]|uniref:Uncharacterized protein n=1 Tax=Owenia fusiformis TaxID=6347 RepID=A0A8S4P058_OWEFU|nr:unnamed protein product [Owenia fusiformis]
MCVALVTHSNYTSAMSLLPLAMLILVLLDFIMMIVAAPISHRKSLSTMITKELHSKHKRDTTELQTKSRQKREAFIPAGLVAGVIKMCDRHSFWCNHHIFRITDEITDRTVQISTGTTSSHAREIRSTDIINRNDPINTHADNIASADIVKSRRRRFVVHGMVMGIIRMCRRHPQRCSRKRIEILDTFTGRRTEVRSSHGRTTASEY